RTVIRLARADLDKATLLIKIARGLVRLTDFEEYTTRTTIQRSRNQAPHQFRPPAASPFRGTYNNIFEFTFISDNSGNDVANHLAFDFRNQNDSGCVVAAQDGAASVLRPLRGHRRMPAEFKHAG